MTDRQSRDRELFNRIAPQYARKDQAMSSMLARRASMLSTFRRALRIKPNLGTILDIGCGIGATPWYLRGLYERYIGVDQSEELIAVAREVHHDTPGAEFIAADARSPEIPSHCADVILSFGALHHMEGLDEVVDSLHRLARPGALLVGMEPQRSNPIIQLARWIRARIDPAYSDEQIFFTEGELREILTRHGFQDIQFDYQGYFATPFAQVIMNPQAITVPLSRLAVALDRVLERLLPKPLDRLSWNIAITARFPGRP